MEWKSVKNDTPPFAENVLVYCQDGSIRIDIMVPNNSYGVSWSGCMYEDLTIPTHWIELPKPPIK